MICVNKYYTSFFFAVQSLAKLSCRHCFHKGSRPNYLFVPLLDIVSLILPGYCNYRKLYVLLLCPLSSITQIQYRNERLQGPCSRRYRPCRNLPAERAHLPQASDCCLCVKSLLVNITKERVKFLPPFLSGRNFKDPHYFEQ